MSVNHILRQSGLRKAAPYHHFASKIELSYTVLDQVIKPLIARRWLNPLTAYDDPILGVTATLEALRDSLHPEELKRSCPLNKLALEMSRLDEGLRRRIATVFHSGSTGLLRPLPAASQAGSFAKTLTPGQLHGFWLPPLKAVPVCSRRSIRQTWSLSAARNRSTASSR